MRWSYRVGVALFIVSAQAAFAGPANPQVLVSTPPLKPYLDQLLLGIGESDSLLRAGQDAHTFTLSPSQRRALAEADIIVTPAPQVNPVLDQLLAVEEKRGAQIITLSDLPGADVLPYPEHDGWTHTHEPANADKEHAPEKTDEHALLDPHLWLDPLRMAAIAAPLADRLGDYAVTHRARLKGNATKLALHLREEVHPGLTALLDQPASNKMRARPLVPFITYHAAYQYFLRRYGLEQAGAVTARPENYLGAKTLHNTLASAEKLSIGCIISETENPLVKRLAAASGARIVALSPETLYGPKDVPPVGWARNDYDRLLVKTALSFADCL